MLKNRVLHRIGLVILVGSTARAQMTELVSVSSTGVQGTHYSSFPSMSPDGRFVSFYSTSSTLDPNYSGSGIFLRDRQAATTTFVSVSSTGAAPDWGGDEHCSVSANGRFVSFQSGAGNLGVSNPNHVWHVYVRDCLLGTTTCVDVDPIGNPGNSYASDSSMSADGHYVVFSSDSVNLVPGDANGRSDVFRYDLQSGAMSIASVDSTGAQGNRASYWADISADGRFVAFVSEADNLVPSDLNAVMDIFVHDFQLGVTRRVSVDSSGAEANGVSGTDVGVMISGDGTRVLFASMATNLSPIDNHPWSDLFIHDLLTGQTQLVNRDSSGVQRGASSSGSYGAGLSQDGRFVAFASNSIRLVPGDTNGFVDIFLRELEAGVTTRVSVSGSGVQSNGHSNSPALSADGRLVAFLSEGSQLASGDANGVADIFVHDRAPAAAAAFCLGDGSQASCPCANTGNPGRGCQNSSLTGGAVLRANGLASLGSDTLRLTSFGEGPTALSVFAQATGSITPTSYGDGLRCVGGIIKRLYARSAILGVVVAPGGTEPSISSRSAAMGDTIPAGATRFYQVQYRDPSLMFCPSPTGNSWNVSSAISLLWGP